MCVLEGKIEEEWPESSLQNQDSVSDIREIGSLCVILTRVQLDDVFCFTDVLLGECE